MSRTELRALLAIAAAAFALRAASAVLTEFHPIFPAYYYTDAVLADRAARETLGALAPSEPRDFSYSTSQKAHILLTTWLYRAVGPRPLAPKLLNALAASLGVLAFGLFAGKVFGERVGAASALLLALWPSHVFFTSQNFKEGLSCGALMGAFFLLAPRAGGPGPRPASAAAGHVLLVLLGFLRAPVMLAAAGAAGAAALYSGVGRRRRAPLALLACVCAPFVYQGAARALLAAPAGLSAPEPAAGSAPPSDRFSPRGIGEYRRARQRSDRDYARGKAGRELGEPGREIATQLFPDERLETWLDVARFVPKASFHILFMPLPGFYPMDGKPGRMLAATENLGLLALAVLALASAARGGIDPGRALALLFFAAMTLGSSFVELDLGGAGRHKLMYLPMLFPFAAKGAFDLMGSRSA